MDGLNQLCELAQNAPLHTAGDYPPSVIQLGESEDSQTEEDTMDASTMLSDDMLDDLESRGEIRKMTLIKHTKIRIAQTSKTTTQSQYGKLVSEYKDWCRALYGGQENVTVDRAFQFLQWQAHRPFRAKHLEASLDPEELEELPEDEEEENIGGNSGRRKKKKKKTTKKGKYKFRVKDYTDVIDSLVSSVESGTVNEAETGTSKISSSQYQLYRSALLDYCADPNVVNLIRNYSPLKQLGDLVSKREKYMKRNSCKEKTNGFSEKLNLPSMYPKIEKQMWDEKASCTQLQTVAGSFRNRYVLISTAQTASRHETHVSSLLSDIQYKLIPLKGELEDYPTLVRTIPLSKTHGSDTAEMLQAKSFRHKQVQFCEHGALAMYLFARFNCTNEDLDFSSNRHWYNITTLVGLGNRTDEYFASDKYEAHRREGIQGKSYYTKIRTIMKKFGMDSSHAEHFGRAFLPVALELGEVMLTEISDLGYWSRGTLLNNYALNMPWHALRVAAGFPKDKGHYRVARGVIKVPLELQKKVFPNIERAKATFRLLPEETQLARSTARRFFDLMEYLSIVLVQDACALMFHLPERATHRLFQEPFFKCTEFREYQNKFLQAYPPLIHPSNDPTIDPIKRFNPIVGHHLGNLSTFQHQTNQLLACLVQENFKYKALLEQIYYGEAPLSRRFEDAVTAFTSTWQNSPTRKRTRDCAFVDYEEEQEATTPLFCARTRPTTVLTTPALPHACPHDNGNTNAYPEFKSTSYSSLEHMYNDYVGGPESPFRHHGGLIELGKNQHPFRKNLSGSEKKMLQRLRRICEYVDSEIRQGKTKDVVFAALRHDISQTPKKESLSGLDNMLRDKRKETDSQGVAS